MFSRPKPYKNRATVWEYVLVVLISCSLFGMGGWVWIDNRWAFIPGISDPAQAGLELAALFGAESGEAQVKAPPAEAASIINSYASVSNQGRSNSFWAALVFTDC